MAPIVPNALWAHFLQFLIQLKTRNGKSQHRYATRYVFKLATETYRTGGSVVDIVTGYGLDGRRGVGVRAPVGCRILASTYRPHGLWGPPYVLSHGYR
jgi:hypothetical protein